MIMMNNGGDEAARVQKGGGSDGKMLRWESLIARGLRVLLVESDESTRQVIAALLRKCCYKVAAVSDGLEAWEVLKQKPNGIDLILTEEALPSISGFALLTLIMEHESCKNIPVIMMSKNDSVSVVYKCMLRGAADFLVKPVRKNELQNLWQHVWRRQANACGGQGVQDESITQPKGDGLLGYVLIIDESSGTCTRKNEDCNEKGNDAQSSCSVPGADGAKMGLQEDFGCTKLYEDRKTLTEASDNNDALISGSREAIDLIGTFQNHSTESCVKSSVINGINKNDSCPRLDLSLRRSDDSHYQKDIPLAERRTTVHRSNTSAFSRYVAAKPTHCIQVNSQPREYEGSSDNHMSGHIQPIDFRINSSHMNTQMSSVNQESSDLKQGESPFSGLQLGMDPVTIHVNGESPNRMCTSYGSGLHPSYYNHLNASPTPSPDSNLDTSSCINQMALRHDPNLETRESIKNVSSERSQNSCLSNAVTGRLNSLSNDSSNPVEGITAQEVGKVLQRNPKTQLVPQRQVEETRNEDDGESEIEEQTKEIEANKEIEERKQREAEELYDFSKSLGIHFIGERGQVVQLLRNF